MSRRRKNLPMPDRAPAPALSASTECGLRRRMKAGRCKITRTAGGLRTSAGGCCAVRSGVGPGNLAEHTGADEGDVHHKTRYLEEKRLTTYDIDIDTHRAPAS